MAADELTPEEMAKLGAKDAPDELSPDEMNARTRPKSKYPDPKSFSADDAALGIRRHKEPIHIGDVGLSRFAREVVSPNEEGDEDFAFRTDPAARQKWMERITPGIGGVGIAGQAAKTGMSIGLNALAKSSKAATLAERTAEMMKNALGHTVETSIVARGINFLAPGAVKVAEKAATGLAIPAAKAVAPAAAPVAGSVLSNAVDKLRASAGISPSAMDFTKRMQAAAATPNGTVTQGTLGGEP